MGLFGSKKKDEVKGAPKAVKAEKVAAKTPAKAKKVAKKATDVVAVEKSAVAAGTSNNAAISANENNRVILRPRITEKATLLADSKNVFVFEISQDATKRNVRKAVTSIYGVIPVKVAIVRNPSKDVFSRGKMGVVSGVKKAYVYLKAGDKIEIV